MGRPCKAVITMSKNLTNNERETRLENENNLKGRSTRISPPQYLNAKQKKIFRHIVNELKASGILGNLDIYILTLCSFAIDRLQEIETMINEIPKLMTDKDLMASKDKYTKDLFRCTNELSLSPQARAKIGNINFQDKVTKTDPVLKIVRSKK